MIKDFTHILVNFTYVIQCLECVDEVFNIAEMYLKSMQERHRSTSMSLHTTPKLSLFQCSVFLINSKYTDQFRNAKCNIAVRLTALAYTSLLYRTTGTLITLYVSLLLFMQKLSTVVVYCWVNSL